MDKRTWEKLPDGTFSRLKNGVPVEPKDWNLSDQICALVTDPEHSYYLQNDVKEFIKRLKEELWGFIDEYPGILTEINKLAGEKLC